MYDLARIDPMHL
jgi:hypothetical protein